MHDQTREPEPAPAYCPRCNRHDIRTYREDGVRKYRTHEFVPDGEMSCWNSGAPVTGGPNEHRR